MGKNLTARLLFSCFLATLASSANILVLYPGSGKSHKIAVMPIVEELAERGHQITIVSPYPTSTKSSNIKDIVLTESADFFNNIPYTRFDSMTAGFFEEIALLLQEMLDPVLIGYEAMMKHPEFKQILKDKQIDLVILDGLFTEYCRVISHHLQVPSIEHFSSADVSPMHISPMGAAADYSHVPSIASVFTSEMTFFQRMFNMIQSEIKETAYKYLILRAINQMTHKDFPDSPSIEELRKDTSLIIINSHPVVSWPRSLPPSVVTIGALHTRPANLISKELETFVTDSKDGFILFTLGSMTPGSSMPKKALQAFMNVFAKLPQKIIWKWENEAPENLPNNILLSKWLPQQDLLGHPNAKLFISHGGLQGTYESIYHAVPLLCLPLWADQFYNCVKAKKEGYSLSLSWNDISDETLEEAITQLLNNPTFKKNATRVSSLIKDEMIPGKDIGAYWVEHVLRHGGTKHLQSPGKDMAPYQRYLLDVIAFLGLVLLILLCATYRSLKWIVHKCFTNSTTKKKKKN